MSVLLGVDLGTTGLKAVVFDLEGKPLGRGLVANSYLPGPPGWAEQDPRSWWRGCCDAIQSALWESRLDPGRVAGIGVCGFHHCPVFLSAEGEPTRPCIVTHDRRLGESLDDLRRTGLLEEIVEKSGSQVVTGHFPPIYHYVLRNDRSALRKTRWILLAKDYLRFKLTGKIGTEICDATGTHLVGMPEQDWSEDLCGLLQVPRETLPEIGLSSRVCGQVSEEAAAATGLRSGTPVVYGGGDSHCALVGLGVTGSAEAGLLLGTNSTLRACFQGFVSQPRQAAWVQQHVIPDRYTVSASSMAGSSVLAWFKDTWLPQKQYRKDREVYDELESLADRVPPGSEGLLFHPYLQGERSPFHNPEARGAFLAVSAQHGMGHFVRSIMEGVSFAIANCLDVAQETARARGESISAIRTGRSGGSRLRVWRQIIADALGLGLEVMQGGEPGCLGAALLAGVGAGEYSELEAAIECCVRVDERTFPDPANAAVYRERRIVFNNSYRALEPILYR
jgi:xylulokinase